MAYGITLEISGDYALFSRPEMKVERVSYDVITPSAARGVLEAIYWKPQIRWVVDRIHVLNPIRFTNIRRNEIATKIPVPSTEFRTSGKQTAKFPKVRKKKVKGTLSDVHLTINQRVEKKQTIAHLRQDEKVIPVASNSTGYVTSLLKQPGDDIKSDDPFFEFVPDIGIAVDDPDSRQQRAAMLLRDVRYRIEAHFQCLTNDEPGKHLDMFNRRARKGQCFHQPYLGCREFPARFELVEDSTPANPDESLMGEHNLGWMLHGIEFDQDPQTKKVKSATPRFFRAVMNDGVIDVPPFHTSCC